MAQASLDEPFAEGFLLSPIDPAPAGDRFFLVRDGATDAALSEDDDFPLRAMALFHLTLGPTIRRTDGATGETRNIVARQLYAHANLSYVPLPWLLLNADMPFAALQEGEGPAAPAGALGDLRLGARAGVLGDRKSGFSLGPSLDVWVPTGDPDNLSGDGEVRVAPGVSASGRIGDFIYSARVGYQIRKHLFNGSLEIGDSLLLGAGAGLLLFDDMLQLGGELDSAFLTETENDLAFQSRTSPMMALFGAKVQLGDVNLGLSAGPSLSDAPGSASRVMASLAFVPSATVKARATVKLKADADGDGYSDPEDACPEEPGTIASGERRGCPEVFETVEPMPAAPVDSDGDGVMDPEDACPDKLGVSSTDDPKQNGCPEPARPKDSDGDGVPDTEDACPVQAGVAVADRETLRGCPKKEPEPAVVAPPEEKPIPVAEQKEEKPAPAAKPKKARKPARSGSPVATFVGFRKLSDTRVLVFVELTGAAVVEMVQKGREVSALLPGARVTLRNNRNPLLATHFHSIVESAKLAPDGKKGVKLVIRLRGDADTTARIVKHEMGATLEVEVQGKAPLEPPASGSSEPPAQPGSP